MGLVHTPMGIGGDGEIEATPEGLRITGSRGFNSGGAVGCLGFVVGAFVCGAAAVALHVGGGTLVVLGGVAGATAAVVLAKRLVTPKTDPILVPWDKVKSLGLDGPHVSFVSRGKPSGQVWFWPAESTPQLPSASSATPANAVALRRSANSALIDEIRAVAAAQGAKV